MRLYRALLHLYPAGFRAEYGSEMCAVFARRKRDSGGGPGLAALWLETLLDVAANAAAAHADILRQDLRSARRTIARNPGFALTVVMVASLGIGATTAAYSITDHVLLRPLPFADYERLVKLWQNDRAHGRNPLSPANYRDWKRMSTAFESMAAYRSLSVNLVGSGEPERLEGAAVTAELFPMLGVPPILGRGFTSEDDRHGAPGTLVLSYRFWQAAYGGDAGVLGRQVRLDDRPYTIIGVMPREFHFPRRDAEIWTAMQFAPSDFEERDNTYIEGIAKLARGVSLEQARSEMDVIASRLEQQYPKENERTGASVLRLREELSNQRRVLLLSLFGAALCVLLIACSNLANLLLARTLARRKELAVRAALGAGGDRLVCQLLTESLTLSHGGGVLGVLLTLAAAPVLGRLVPTTLPIAAAPAIDLRVLLFAAGATILTGVGFGVLPAVRACRGGAAGLQEGQRASVGERRERLRAALVTAEVTISVVLLASSGLLIRAMWRLQARDPGFRAGGVLTLRTVLPVPRYERVAERQRFYARVLGDIKALPGVSHAAYTSFLPMVLRGGIWPVTVRGRENEPRSDHGVSLRFVTSDFFSTLSIPLRLGRDVGDADTRDAPFTAVVSDSFARRYWPGENPIGRRFSVAFHERIVVGVVGDVRVRGLETISEPQVYLPYRQVQDGWLAWYTPKDLAIRASTPLESLIPAVRRIVRTADPDQPVSEIRPLADIVEAETGARRVQVRVLVAFAASAFLLAAVGIHGLLSFAVSTRAQEFGVRIALGARPRDILGMVLGESAVLSGAGVVLGLVLAYLAGRGLEALLAGVRPADAATVAAAVGLSVLMALAGSIVPALRAVRIDPAATIRAE
jgi:putative ABC transport system permease protein